MVLFKIIHHVTDIRACHRNSLIYEKFPSQPRPTSVSTFFFSNGRCFEVIIISWHGKTSKTAQKYFRNGNAQINHRTSSSQYPQSNSLAKAMVKVSKNQIEKAILQDHPWNQLLLDYRCTPISSEVPSPGEILFGRKFWSSISILPSQVFNDRIIVKKEGKFYSNSQEFSDRITSMAFEAGQNVWFQNSDSRKYGEAVIQEKCREPNSYMVEIPGTEQHFRRNSDFIKPRHSEENSISTRPQPPPVILEEDPNSQATSTVNVVPIVPTLMQNRNSTPQVSKTSSRINRGVPPSRLSLQEWTFYM